MNVVLAMQSTRGRRATYSIALGAMLVGGMAIAQTPPPLPAPDLPLLGTGVVRDIVRQSDGSMIVAGRFEFVEGTPRRNLTRMLSDGSLDQQWDPSPDGEVEAVAIGPDGWVYAVGSFTEIGGAARNGLARLSGIGSGMADPAWTPPVGPPRHIEVDTAGRVYVGGFGTTVKRLLPDGSLDPDWPQIFDVPSAMALAANHLYIAGSFSTPTGFASVLRISISSPAAVDPAWRATHTGAYSDLAIGDDGMVYLAGGGIGTPQGVRSVVRMAMAGTGEPDPTWSVETGFQALTVAARAGAVYVGGSFATVNGQAVRCLARLSGSAPAVLHPTWASGCNGMVEAIDLGADGSVAAGGAFTTMGATVRLGFGRLDQLAQPQPSVRVQRPGAVEVMVAHPDGSVIVTGNFQTSTPPRNHLLKLASDGSIDAAWAPQVDRPALAMAVDGQGRTYLSRLAGGGSGLPDAMLLRLTSTGEVDTGWSPEANGIVLALASDADGWTYLGGQFTQVDGVTMPYLARLDPDGELDTSWQPLPDAQVHRLLLDGLGRLYAMGWFSQIGGAVRPGLARLLASGMGAVDQTWQSTAPQNAERWSFALHHHQNLLLGERSALRWLSTVDGSWDPARDLLVDDGISSIAVDAAGAIYLAGGFRQAGGIQRRTLAKVGSDGLIDQHWNPHPIDGIARAVSVRVDGSILAGGTFEHIGATRRFALAALAPDVDALFANGFELPQR